MQSFPSKPNTLPVPTIVSAPEVDATFCDIAIPHLVLHSKVVWADVESQEALGRCTVSWGAWMSSEPSEVAVFYARNASCVLLSCANRLPAKTIGALNTHAAVGRISWAARVAT
jgi:hypothetical protein